MKFGNWFNNHSVLNIILMVDCGILIYLNSSINSFLNKVQEVKYCEVGAQPHVAVM